MSKRRQEADKKHRHAVTATYIGKHIRRFARWEFKYDTTKEEAEDEIRIVQGENANWPEGTTWKVRRL